MAEKENAKSKNMMYVWIGVCVVVAVVILAVVLVKKNSGGGEADPGVSETTNAVTASELEKPVESVAYGDFTAMQDLSKRIQNGEMTGKVVEVDGLVNHPGTSYSIVEPNESGTQKIGTVFTIQDGGEYPADGTRVTIKAKVVETTPLVFQLVTLKDYVVEK